MSINKSKIIPNSNDVRNFILIKPYLNIRLFKNNKNVKKVILFDLLLKRNNFHKKS